VSWNRKLVVFSSSFADVKRGVLFSLYPDNKAMGQQLGRLLEQRQQNQSAPATIYPVEDLLTAVNLRTAEHLGLHFSHSDIEGFHYVYPSR
jgi:putative ABC transport system substrate-binding protein